MCGIFGIANHSDASQMTYLGLYALQHRGQESTGISSSDGDQVYTHKVDGLCCRRVFRGCHRQTQGRKRDRPHALFDRRRQQ